MSHTDTSIKINQSFRESLKQTVIHEFEKSNKTKLGLQLLLPVFTSLALSFILVARIQEPSQPIVQQSHQTVVSQVDQNLKDLEGMLENDQEFSQLLESL